MKNEVKKFLLYVLSGISSAQERKPSILKNKASMSKTSREKLLGIAGKIDSRDKIGRKMCLDSVKIDVGGKEKENVSV